MQFPLSFWDISLWLAVTALILLVTLELISQSYLKSKIPISKKNLRIVTYSVGILFLITVIIRFYEIFIST
jgi:hypothetical protein